MRMHEDKEYHEKEYIHFLRQHDGSNREIGGKGGSTRNYSGYDAIEIPFEDFLKINLNVKGESVPFSTKNVINISRYMIWYWMPTLGSDAIATYILLTEYCSEETDFCFPKIKDLSSRLGRSIPTVNKALAKLEEYNFIIVVNRLIKNKGRRETSPLYKVRQTTPLISDEQYQSLPKKLQEKHDEFMKKHIALEVPKENHDHQNTVNELLSTGDVLLTKRREERLLLSLQLSQKNEAVLALLTGDQTQFNTLVHEALQADDSGMTKPSYDSFFYDSVFVKDTDKFNSVTVVCSEAMMDMLEGHTTYFELLRDVMGEISNVKPIIRMTSHDEFIG